jgi:hypothetical protein
MRTGNRIHDAQPALTKTQFTFDQLRGVPTKIYIALPAAALVEYRELFRVMSGVCMREMREARSAEEDDRPRPPVLYLTEFQQLHPKNTKGDS